MSCWHRREFRAGWSLIRGIGKWWFGIVPLLVFSPLDWFDKLQPLVAVITPNLAGTIAWPGWLLPVALLSCVGIAVYGAYLEQWSRREELERRLIPSLTVRLDPDVYVMSVPGNPTNVVRVLRLIVQNTSDMQAKDVRVTTYAVLPSTANVHLSARLQVTHGASQKSATSVPPRGIVRFDLASQRTGGPPHLCYAVTPAQPQLSPGCCLTLRAESEEGHSGDFDVVLAVSSTGDLTAFAVDS